MMNQKPEPSDTAGSSKSNGNRQQFNVEKYLQQKGDFTMVPNDLFRKMDLKPWPRMLWMYLLSHHQDYHPLISQIMADTGISKPTVVSGLKALENVNMIQIFKDGTSSHYNIMAPNEWTVSRHISEPKGKKSLPNKNLKVKNLYPEGKKSLPTLSIDNTNYNTKNYTTEQTSQIDSTIEAVRAMFAECGYNIKIAQLKYTVGIIHRNLGFTFEEISEYAQEAGPFFISERHAKPVNGLFNWFKNRKNTSKTTRKPPEPSLSDWGVA